MLGDANKIILSARWREKGVKRPIHATAEADIPVNRRGAGVQGLDPGPWLPRRRL